METIQRWWRHPADPAAVGVEVTVSDSNDDVIVVSGIMQDDFIEITEVEYDAVISARDLVQSDPLLTTNLQSETARTARAAAAETAHTDLVGLGLSAATASFLTGHTP